MKKSINSESMNRLILKMWCFGLIAGFLFCIPSQSYASHIIGGEITYKCLGNNQYEITLDVFRDCYFGTANFDNPAKIRIFNNVGVEQPAINISPLFIESVAVDVGDPCLFVPDSICVERARYQTIVTLASYNGGYDIVYQRCCRNQTISNIVDPDETGATYSIHLSEKSMAECNSSPVFGPYPPGFICVNKPIDFLHNATDVDGDSLVYRFCNPLIGGSINSTTPDPVPPPYDSVIWVNPPYNLDNLLGGNIQPLTIDSSSGQIVGFPQIKGQFVVGVCVEEYRDGELLSTVRRDFQYNVGDCGEIVSNIIAPDIICLEEGDPLTVQFENESTLADDFVWYFDWPNTDIPIFDSLPNHTFPDTGAYTIALISEPTSQCVDTGFHTIFLQYNQVVADFDISTFDCTDASVVVLEDLSSDAVSNLVEWNWELNDGQIIQTSSQQNPVFTVPNPSSGTVTLTVKTANGCVRTLQKDYESGGNNPDDMIDNVQDICFGESTNLNPNVGANAGFTFFWGPPLNTPEINPAVSPTQNTNYPVTITAFNGGCSIETNVMVNVTLLPELDFEFDAACDGVTVSFTNQSINTPGYVWGFGDPIGLTSTNENPTFTYPTVGTWEVTLSTPPNTLCPSSITENIVLEEKILIADFEFSYTDCSTESITVSFQDISTNTFSESAIDQWFWQFGNGETSTAQNPLITLTQEQILSTQLTITTSEGCVATTTENLNIDFIEYDFDESVLMCWNESTVLNPNGDPAYTYDWFPKENIINPFSPNPTVMPTETTTYSVIITNVAADTCSVTKEVTVVVPPAIGLDATNNLTTCDAQVDLVAMTNFPVDLEWLDGNGTFISNASSITVDVSGASTYEVFATDQNGCEEKDFVVILGGPVEFDLTDDQELCTDDVLNITLNNLDNNDILTLEWTPTNAFIGDPSNDPTPQLDLVPGEQTVWVEATNQFGCILTDSINLAIVDADIDLNFDFQVQCNGSTVDFSNLSANAYNYVWDFGDPNNPNDQSSQESPTYTYSEIGTYIVTLDIGFDVACAEPITKEIEIVSPDFIPGFSYEFDDKCSTDSVTIFFYDESINFLDNTETWTWEFSNGVVISGGNERDTVEITVSNSMVLTATLTIGTPNDCEGSTSQTLEILLPELPAPIGGEVILCYGDTTALNPSGLDAFTYQWTPTATISDPTIANPMAFPLESTIYEVQVTSISADTCTVTGEVTVTVPERIEVIGSSDSTTTCGSAITVTAFSNLDPEVDYFWEDLNGNTLGIGSFLLVNPTTTTTVIVEGTDEFNCFDRDSIFVSNEELSFSIDYPEAACPNDTIEISVASDILDHDLSFQWVASGGGSILTNPNLPVITIVTAPAGQTASFTLMIENQFDCTAEQTVTVNSHDFVPPVIDSLLICPGIETNINPLGDDTYTYAWSPANTVMPPNVANPSVTILQSEVFQVTVTKAYGDDVCLEILETEVEVAPIIDIEETVDTLTCGEPITICAETNVPVTFEWYDEFGDLIGTAPCFENADPELVATYTVIAADIYECFETDTVVVFNQQTDLQIDGNGFITTCPRDSFQICINNLDLTDTLTYQWEVDPNGIILSGDTLACPWITTTPNETAFFTVSVSNQFGCTETQTLEVQTYEFDAVVEDTVRVCAGVSTELNPSANIGLFYSWFPTDGLSDPNSPNPIVTVFESINYTATIFGFNGPDTCMATIDVAVIVNPLINLATTPDNDVLCEETDISLTALSETIVDFTWSQNPDFSDPILQENQNTVAQVTVTPMGFNDYYVLAVDDLGCRDSAMIEMNSFPITTTLSDNEIDFCKENGAASLSITNLDPLQELTYLWQPEESILTSNTANPIDVNPAETTTFIVNIENQFGCKLTDSVLVNVFDLDFGLEVSASPDTIIFGSSEFSQLQATINDTYSYDWSPCNSLDVCDVFDPQAMPEETTEYTLTVTNEQGCVADRSVTVVVINPDCEEPFIFIPSAFTPNGDGENDVFHVRGNTLESLELVIYNRWGQKVFETTSKDDGWDGSFKNEYLSPDVYGYYLKAKCFNGQEFFKKGNVSLLR